MVALSTIIRFVQEGRSHRATESLRAMVSNTAMVIRCEPGVSATVKAGKPQEIALCELVEGDMVSLSAGDMIPADCRILKARDLFVAQSAMTVESLPVEKFAQATPTSDETEPSKGLLAQRNVVFMGTNVVSGTAQALVVAIGG